MQPVRGLAGDHSESWELVIFLQLPLWGLAGGPRTLPFLDGAGPTALSG